ncbi:MAG: trimethylamine methyltransferase family protein [Planctomycetota bacterium]
MMTAIAGADCIHLAAGMLDSGNSISYEQYVIDNEIIGMIHRLLAGINVDKDTIGLDVIEKVGPGGNYIMEDHTVDHMMKEFFYPELSVRSIFDVWEKEGRPSMMSRANSMVKEILEEEKDGLLDINLISEIKKAFPDIVGI